MIRSESKVIEARKKLKGILRKAERNGISRSDLNRLSTLKIILNKLKKNERNDLGKIRIFAVFLGCLSALLYAANIHPHEGFSALWLRWHRLNVNEEPCTVAMPDEVARLFRPPVTCSICLGLHEIEKVANLSSTVFEERYAYTGKPVVVTDAMHNWTAQHIFSFEFFKKIYTDRMDRWKLHNCQFFPYSTEFEHLGQVFNMSKERAQLSEGSAPWYVGWSNCDNEINQILRRHYEKPYFLPDTAETKRLDWIFMGSSGFGAPMHVDNVEHPSWQAQLKGRKKWNLQPPPECYYSCENIQVVVEPGEIIVLDTNRWYHSTLIVSKEMSITIGAEYD